VGLGVEFLLVGDGPVVCGEVGVVVESLSSSMSWLTALARWGGGWRVKVIAWRWYVMVPCWWSRLRGIVRYSSGSAWSTRLRWSARVRGRPSRVMEAQASVTRSPMPPTRFCASHRRRFRGFRLRAVFALGGIRAHWR
jgi:hypothetical protein